MNKEYIERAIMSAEGFVTAAKLLMEENNKDGWRLAQYAPAITTNLALACEIYMKQIIGFTEEKYTSGHYLRYLYNKIEVKEKEIIERKFKTEVKLFLEKNPNWMQELSIDSCLDKYNVAFENWRYIYEPEKADANYVAGPDLEILASVLEEYIKDKLG